MIDVLSYNEPVSSKSLYIIIIKIRGENIYENVKSKSWRY